VTISSIVDDPTVIWRRRPSWSAALVAPLLLSQLGGCAGLREPPEAAVSDAQAVVPQAWHDRDAVRAGAASADLAELAQWWASFGDPLLSSLVERALSANTDLAAATGRLRSARAAVTAAQGGLLPSLSASGGASRSGTLTEPANGASSFNLGVDASWEVDLFGKLSGSVEAARADLASSQASLFDVQRAITAEVALNYLTLRDAQARLEIAESNLSIQRENLQIAQWRYQAGLANALEVEQATTLVAQTEASLPSLRQSITTSVNQIDVLTAQAPGASAPALLGAAPVPDPPALAAIGLPADLLERRPDVIASRHSLEAAVIRIGVARADLYPALRLSGSIDTSAAAVGGLFGTLLGNVAAGLSAPIFEGGKIRARIEQQRGSADTALANYRAAILKALQDVENAVVAARTATEREEALARAEAAARESLQLAELRYRSGVVDFQVLLDAQRTLLSAQDSRQSARTARSTAAVQLFKALGGGWPAGEANEDFRP
jgi:NodT family efflux transporter outer membrane factor (OMF) lipoprotein